MLIATSIRERAAEVSPKYGPTVDVGDLAETNRRTIVTGRASGPVPGSPIDLGSVLALDGTRIARLETS